MFEAHQTFSPSIAPSDTSSAVSGLQALMDDYVDGNQRAFAELHARLSPRIRARLARLIRDKALVDDLVQLTFMRAHQGRSRFSTSATTHQDRAVEAWYLAIARNVALDWMRHQYRRDRRHATLEARGEVDGMGVPDPPLSPEELGMERELSEATSRRVREAIDRLPPTQREVVTLHKLGGMSMSEIAERLEIRPGALRVRAHRAYKALAQMLVPQGAPTAA
jgi:RNA polymerase sigma-70 factor (ECF subfamily)